MPPNVLLLISDSLRAENCSLYGYQNETTPFLEEFADQSTVYTQARSPSWNSRPSHVCFFTGYHAIEHRLEGDEQLKQGTTIWEELNEEYDYRTGVFSDNPGLVDNSFGLLNGFERHVVGPADVYNPPFPGGFDPRPTSEERSVGESFDKKEAIQASLASGRPLRSLANGVCAQLTAKYPDILPDRFVCRTKTTGEILVDGFLDWQSEQSGHWAACLNLMDTHYPYEPGPEHDLWSGRLAGPAREVQDILQQYRFNKHGITDCEGEWSYLELTQCLYDGTIRQVDAEIARTIATLRERGELEDTLVIVTGDHGECFGETSRIVPDERLIAHGHMHEACLHVPLVVSLPGQDVASVEERPASLTELPSVVRSVVAGEESLDGFVPDGDVIVSTELDHDRIGFAVYQQEENGSVVKTAKKGDHYAVIRSWGPGVAVKESAGGQAFVDDYIAKFSDAEVTVSNDGIEHGAKERLKELGYI